MKLFLSVVSVIIHPEYLIIWYKSMVWNIYHVNKFIIIMQGPTIKWVFYAGCKEYGKVDSTARWRQIGTLSSISWQCSDVIGRAFTRKLTGFETTIVITRTFVKINWWDFPMTSTIVLLKLSMSCNNSLKVTVLSLWLSKDEKIVSLLNEINKH